MSPFLILTFLINLSFSLHFRFRLARWRVRIKALGDFLLVNKGATMVGKFTSLAMVILLLGWSSAISVGQPQQPKQPAPEKTKPDDLLKEHRDRLKIEEEKHTFLVDEVIRTAVKNLANDPDGALDGLKTVLNRVKDHPDLSAEVRDTLVTRLQSALRNAAALLQESKLKKQLEIRDPEVPRFTFKIDPKTPLEALLPVPPKVKPHAGPILVDDLTKVPELTFQEPLPIAPKAEDMLKQIAHQLAKINHANLKKTDAFMEALLAKRDDLGGLPFVMGDACRTTGTRSREFGRAGAVVREALEGRIISGKSKRLEAAASLEGDKSAAPLLSSLESLTQTREIQGEGPRERVEAFWADYQKFCLDEDRASTDATVRDNVIQARIAALMQILAWDSAGMRRELAKYLGAVAHVEATRALAKLAIYSPEDEVRNAAIDGLKVRREKDYTAILVAGLRYPWPAVAKRSAEALVKLERADLLPQLVDLLDQPDPRLPVAGKTSSEVRELVRVNHHRNCLLCHAPGNTPNVSEDVLTAAMPVPGSPFPPSGGYGREETPDLLVRIDVTYLRQDFSQAMPVADAHPWPEMQRFDFLVRTRTLTEAEAKVYRDKLTNREPGAVTPYQRAVLFALRELTGRDTAPTADAWRRLLK